jgi:light-regulated signal transduction histidine kinase (bacteriophytochrome)
MASPAPLSDRHDQSAFWQQTLRATLNILEDFQEERSGARESTQAVLNILADFEDEKRALNEISRAMLNILEDFEGEQGVSAQMNRAVINILEDLEEERSLTKALNARLEERVLQRTADLAASNEALERSNIELQRFAYVASHDLQTPMRSVASFVGLLQATYTDKLDARANDWIRRTVESIALLQTLIRDLLQYSRLDSEIRPFESVPFHDVVSHVITLLDASLHEAGAEISCGELPIVSGDRSQLVQLMLNLIGNGIKYRSAEPPRIRVSAAPEGHEWIVSVRDNGIGIAPQYHEQIFEIFKRLHDQREYAGTGIGLAVCRRVVHRHGGRIWVESESGKGSVFSFSLRRER